MLTVYSASAGSGKTYNLVFDYLATCFKGHLSAFLKLKDRSQYLCPLCAGYQHILAITFTNNAAAEMKERVVKQLNALAFAKTADDLNQDDFNTLCQKVFGKKHNLSRDECFLFIHETSKALLHSILYDYARFSITTIDSFIQRVIRSSALYLNLSMNYAVQIRLTDFFSKLGSTDTDGQLEHINIYKISFKTACDNSLEEYKTKSRLYKALGFFVGASIALMIL